MGNLQTTTIRVPKDVAESIKIYTRKHGRNIGDFVESAWDFIQRNDFDIYSNDTTPFLPVQEVEQPGVQQNQIEALCNLMNKVITT